MAELALKRGDQSRTPVSDRRAAELFDQNRKLAYKVLLRFCRRRGLERDDYEAAALAGLWHACRWYDGSTGFAFSTYAWKCVEGSIKSECRLFGGHPWREYSGARDGLLENWPGRPDEDRSDEGIAGLAVALLLQTLPARQREVVALRYGIGSARPLTLDEAGRVFGITKERVRQIEANGLRTLRNRLVVIRRMGDKLFRRAIRLADAVLEPDDHSHNTPGRRSPPADDPPGDMENGVRAWEDADGQAG